MRDRTPHPAAPRDLRTDSSKRDISPRRGETRDQPGSQQEDEASGPRATNAFSTTQPAKRPRCISPYQGEAVEADANQASNSGHHSNGAYIFRLYIAGGAPNSVRALANLYALCHKHFPESHRIEVVDILVQPLRALSDGVIVTPTLIKVSPAPEQQVIGNLSEEAELLHALSLTGGDPG